MYRYSYGEMVLKLTEQSKQGKESIFAKETNHYAKVHSYTTYLCIAAISFAMMIFTIERSIFCPLSIASNENLENPVN